MNRLHQVYSYGTLFFNSIKESLLKIPIRKCSHFIPENKQNYYGLEHTLVNAYIFAQANT